MIPFIRLSFFITTLVSIAATATAQFIIETAGDEHYLRFFNAGGWGSTGNAQWAPVRNSSGWTAFYVTDINHPATNHTTPSLVYIGNTPSAPVGLLVARSDAASEFGSLGTRHWDSSSGGIANGGILMGTAFTNATGADITSISLGYTGEQWALRTGGPGTFSVSYSTDATSILNGSWSAVDALAYSSQRATISGSLITNGRSMTDERNRTVFRPVVIELDEPFPPGATIHLRWHSRNASGIDQTIALDEVRFVANPPPSPFNTSLLVGTDSDPTGRFWDHADRIMDIGAGTAQSGSLVVPSGESLAFYDLYLGADATDAVGTLAVTGPAATARLTRATGFGGSVQVGRDGTGELLVSDDALFEGNFLTIGVHEGSSGDVKVSTGATLIHTHSHVLVGKDGSGTLSVESGGKVEISSHLRLGSGESGEGTVVVTGSGSSLATAGFLEVGAVGSGTLQVDDGGTVEIATNLLIGNGTSNGSTAVVGGGTQTAGQALLKVGGNLAVEMGSAVQVQSGGQLWVRGDIDLEQASGSGDLSIEGGLLRVDGGLNLGLPGITWTGGALRADGYLTGVTTVPPGGSIFLQNGSVVSADGTITLSEGASLVGYGVIHADFHLAAGATLRGEGGPLVVLGTITGEGTSENVSLQLRPATVDDGIETSPFGTLTFTSSLDLTDVLSDLKRPLFHFDLGSPQPSEPFDRIHFEHAELRVGTNGLGLDNFDFTIHPGFGSGVYTLITSTEYIGGSLKFERHGTLAGLPVWLRIGNDAKSVELRVGEAATTFPYSPGESYFGRNSYVEYRAGNLPLIFSSGHDGLLTPEEMPPEVSSTLRDINCNPQTLAVADEIFQRTGRHPHVVLGHVNRARVNMNISLASHQGYKHAQQAWCEYHETFVRDSIDAAVAEFGFALYFDMHGHAHEINRLELGYLVSATELDEADDTFNLPGFGWRSSVTSMMLRNPGFTPRDVVRGPKSVGTLFNEHGVPAWPSAQFPHINGAPYFNGGHTTRIHSLRPEVDVIQIESHWSPRSNATNRANFATAFARVLQVYMQHHYGFSLGSDALHELEAVPDEFSRGGLPITLTIRRSGYLATASTVDLNFSGSATLGTDFTVSSDSASFAAHAETATVTITPAAPGAAVGDRTVVVSLVGDSFTSVAHEQLHLTLGDGVSQTVRVQSASPNVSLGDGEAVFRLRRTDPTHPLLLPLSWEGSAVAGNHFHAPAEAWFEHGSTETWVVATLRDSIAAEDDHSLILRPEPGEGYLIGHPSTAKTLLSSSLRPRRLAVWLTDAIADNVWLDRSGHGRHATTLPAGAGPLPIANPNGPLAVRFDGQSSTAAVPHFRVDPEGAFSIAFHFRLDPLDEIEWPECEECSSSNCSHIDLSGLMQQRNLLSFGEFGWSELGHPGSLRIFVEESGCMRTWLGHSALETKTALDVPGTWADGQWHHYALTVGSDGTARVFLNGDLAAQSTTWEGRLHPDENFWIGWFPARGNSGGFLAGDLRDFRVYHAELTAAETGALASNRLSLQAWMDQFSLTGTEQAHGADTLLRAYAFGFRPDQLAGARWLNVAGDHVGELRFQRQRQASDLRYRIESSSSLRPDDWQVLAELPPDADEWIMHDSGLYLTDQGGRIQFRDDRPATPDERSRFLRLRVDVE